MYFFREITYIRFGLTSYCQYFTNNFEYRVILNVVCKCDNATVKDVVTEREVQEVK